VNSKVMRRNGGAHEQSSLRSSSGSGESVRESLRARPVRTVGIESRGCREPPRRSKRARRRVRYRSSRSQSKTPNRSSGVRSGIGSEPWDVGGSQRVVSLRGLATGGG
jgi:hypothetical protein